MSSKKRLLSENSNEGFVTSEISKEDKAKLRIWNAVLCSLHLASALAIGLLTGLLLPDATVPWYIHTAPPRPAGASTAGWVPKQTFLADVPVGYFAMIFLFLAGTNHLLVSTVLWRYYTKNLAIRRNPVRWFEYSVSASVMHVNIAMLSGCMDLHLCIAIFGLTMTTMFFGWLAEPRDKTSRSDLRAFWIGCVPYAFQWSVIFYYFFSNVVESSPPIFVWSLIFVMFMLDSMFAVNMALDLYRVKWWKSYAFVEVSYCVLSLLNKSQLAWVAFGGTFALKK